MAFFGLTVQPKLKADTQLPAPLSITNVALPHTLNDASSKSSARSTLLVSVNDGDYIPVCSLTPGVADQHNTDLIFEMGASVSFTVDGPNPIAMAGFFHNDDDDLDGDEYASAMGVAATDDDDDESDDEDFDPERMHVDDDSQDDDESDDDDDDDDDDDEDEDSSEVDDNQVDNKQVTPVSQVQAKGKPKHDAPVAPDTKSKSKAAPQGEDKALKSATDKGKSKGKDTKPAVSEKKSEPKPVPTATDPKKRKVPEDKQADNQESTKKAKLSTAPVQQTHTLKGGLQITDLTPVDPTAPKAKSGQRVSMRYIGKLTNGKVFDQNTKGQPFSFKLGQGEVIKGWDMGIVGMSVGQRRKLVIPGKLAYGARGAPPDIPPNATLEFEVKLLSVK